MDVTRRMSGTMDQTYLHDGVYVGHDGFQLWLACEREHRLHEVALDDQAWEQLVRYRERLLARTARLREGQLDQGVR